VRTEGDSPPARAPAWAPPLLALQFLTRVPTPWLARLSPEQAADGLARAMPWLPLVGALIGASTALVFAGAGMLWPPLVAALIALAVEALLTGAFHEDAVADFCDAFGGTAHGEAALAIMKDSRIGTYGALGLGLVVALRVAAMLALPPALAVAAIIGAATFGRLWAVLLAALLAPAAARGMARQVGRLPWSQAACGILAALPGLLPILLARPSALLTSALVGGIFLAWLAAFLRRRIGGSTGDCLGFAAAMGQLSLLLTAAIA
jgi:adenosylcobinamide-GDP ribazoletransferase